jgi:hypothetical protein
MEQDVIPGTEDIIIRRAVASDVRYATSIAEEMASSAKARGTGISDRPPSVIREKILQGKAVIAVTIKGIWVGFSYIETWENEKFVSNSGLIVAPAFRQRGIAAVIKQKIFQLSRLLYPLAKIFSITTGLAVMKLNTRLGFEPVTYSEITKDPAFWQGCRGCVNYPVLCSKQRANCLCTALLFDPEEELQKAAAGLRCVVACE